MNEYVDLTDLSFQYGMGVFDTVLVADMGNVFLLDEHLERLMNSLYYFNFDVTFTKDELHLKITNFIKSNNIKNKILRTTVSYGNPIKKYSPQIFFTLREPSNNLNPLKLCITNSRRNETSDLVLHKTTNYMENYFEFTKASTKGFDDVYFLNNQGFLTETSRSNLFIVKDNVVFTPSIDTGILPGIIRNWLLLQLKTFNIYFKEGDFTLDTLYQADEIFVTNSVIGIRSVCQVDNTYFNNNKSNLAKKLSNIYFEIAKV